MDKIDRSLPHKKFISRFYNTIFFKGNRVIKGVPKDRFFYEVRWFEEAKKRIPNNIPRIYDFHKTSRGCLKNKRFRYYQMEAIKGDNLYKWALDHRNRVSSILDKWVELAKSLHKESYKVKKEDIYKMYYLKPKESIQKFVMEKQIDLDSLIINKQKVKNPLFLLENLYRKFQNSLIDTKYSFIHGDLTMGNTLVDQGENLFLIDPRGKFGDTKIFGDVRYDIAKMYYSIVGNFESLNYGNFMFVQKETNSNIFFYKIRDNGFSFYKKRMLDLFKEDIKIIEFIHATIWLSLMPHVQEDEQFCAFCNGSSLLNSFWREYG